MSAPKFARGIDGDSTPKKAPTPSRRVSASPVAQRSNALSLAPSKDQNTMTPIAPALRQMYKASSGAPRGTPYDSHRLGTALRSESPVPSPSSPPPNANASSKSLQEMQATPRLAACCSDEKMITNVPTSSITFVETAHGRLRRDQRGIDKKDLQAAVKYGIRVAGYPRPNGDAVSVYTFKEIVYITNDVSGEEITSYPVPIVLDKIQISRIIQRQHDKAVLDIKRHKNRWKSNTVIVVDTSGSMKTCDVWGTKTRLDAVWLSLALDFIAQRIEAGAAGLWDVVSIVSLGPTGEILLEEHPTTWVLYNYILDLYNDRTVRAKGHGMYMPSIDAAERLLHQNKNSSCAMGLLFLSDGRPSDHVEDGICNWEIRDDIQASIVKRIEDLSKKFGRRLTFSAIGIGSSDDFVTLKQMVDAASDYGVQASFELPSRSSSGIGTAFSSVATSITSTQTELTDISTLHQREVRSVIRESRRAAALQITHVTKDEFYIYSPRQITRKVYHEWIEGRHRKAEFKHALLQDDRAQYVAFSKRAFGEGAERFAYRFFELASDAQTIVGRPLVVKESRHVLEHGGAHRNDFVKQFCQTQQLARRVAQKFNAKLDSMNVDRKTPRVDVLDCSIYYLQDKSLGEVATLVEPRIDHNKWHKWNANNGYVEGMRTAPDISEAAMQETEDLLETMDLGAIEECSDEEDSDQESEDDGTSSKSVSVFSPSEVAQAFSHFSYWASGRKRLICDLQGVFDEKSNVLRLSDPVIHYYNKNRTYRQNVHGMTDRGRKGINMFWATHKCNRLCFMTTNGFKKANLRGRNVRR